MIHPNCCFFFGISQYVPTYYVNLEIIKIYFKPFILMQHINDIFQIYYVSETYQMVLKMFGLGNVSDTFFYDFICSYVMYLESFRYVTKTYLSQKMKHLKRKWSVSEIVQTRFLVNWVHKYEIYLQNKCCPFCSILKSNKVYFQTPFAHFGKLHHKLTTNPAIQELLV